MKKKRKRKSLPADIAELVKKWGRVVPHHIYRDLQPYGKPPDLLKHARALRKVAARIEREVKKEARMSRDRKAVIIAWEVLTDIDLPLDGSIPKCQSPPTYKELADHVREMAYPKMTDAKSYQKLARNVREIADTLKLPMKSWRLQ